jgi:hypothetical protein
MAKKVTIYFSLVLAFSLFISKAAYSAPAEELLQYWQNTYSASHNQMNMLAMLEAVGMTGKTYKKSVLAKTQADETYNGIPKKNQAYVWGLTKSGNKLWFGTAANVLCLVMRGLGSTTPIETDSFVCEFTSRPVTGDWRPPKMYSYNLTTNSLADITPTSGVAAVLINTTTGIRSAGSIGNTVLLAGPNVNGKAINIFAYDANTGLLIGAQKIDAYNDIRQWVVANNVLYTGVANTAGGGSVLRFQGIQTTPSFQVQFEVVGILDAEGAYINPHEGRLFVTTWPTFRQGTQPRMASLYMSPVIPPSGLNNQDHANGWNKVWEADDYEPDIVTAYMYGGGALHSYEGYLYWGTMHVPSMAGLVAQGMLDLDANGDGTVDSNESFAAFLGTYRPINIFRGKNFGASTQTIDLLYGLQYLPVYDPAKKTYTIANDLFHQNKMINPKPKWGLAGFGNFFNEYTWTMGVYDKKLFIGTFDWSYVYNDVAGDLGTSSTVFLPSMTFLGADLYRIAGTTSKAIPESLLGVGNITSYGIRTMVSDATGLYLGMANPMNLHSRGGWELIKLNKR